MSSTGTCICVIVIVSESGITKVAGKAACVTRTWVSSSVIGLQRRQPQQPLGDALEADLGLAELAHHPRHRPALALDLAGAGGAKLAAVGLVACERLVLEVAVQERRVRRIDADLERLQPVAVPQALEGEAVARRRDEGVECRQRRRRRALGAEPREEHAGALLQRIAALADRAVHSVEPIGSAGVSRQAPSTRELPAVERAAQAVVLAATEREIGAAVRAGRSSRPQRPLPSRNSTRSWPSRRTGLTGRARHARIEARIELVEQRRRLPVAAHQRAAGRSRADARDQFVLLGLHAACSR